MSTTAIANRGTLFLSKTLTFSGASLGTSVTLDTNNQPRLWLNFNVTPNLHCDFVTV